MDEPIGSDAELVLAMLAHVSRRRPSEWTMIGDLLHLFGARLNALPDLNRNIEVLESNGLIASLEPNETITRTFIKITLQGRRRLDRRVGQQSDILIYERGLTIPDHIVGELARPGSISSQAWTGRAKRRFVDPRRIEDIERRLKALKTDIEGSELSNTEKACAGSICKALLALIESPEPEWHIMVELLRHPAFSASVALAGFVQLIIGLILSH